MEPSFEADITMSWPRIRWALATLLGLWLLVANVYVQFSPVRHKLVKAPQAGQDRVSVALTGIETVSTPQLVLVCVVRNEGASPLDLSVSVGGQVLRQTVIAPASRSRLDIAWARRGTDPAATSAVDLDATGGPWTLDYLELANLHGFTRGAVDLLILPAAQPFGRGPAWWVAVFVACALLAGAAQPDRWPAWLRVPWFLMAGVTASALFAIALSAFLSPFRVVLSPGTFLLGLFVLAAPRVATLARQTWRKSGAIYRRLEAVPWPLVLTIAAVIAYGLFLARHVGAYAAGSDSSGYMNSARLLSEFRVSTPRRLVADVPASDLPSFAYVPLGFRPHGPAEMAPTYPIGLPLLLLPMTALLGWHVAPHVTMIWHALLGVGLTYWLGRVVGLSRGLAAVGAITLATSQQYLFSSLTFMSDTPALVWVTAAVLLAWKSRGGAGWAALSGMALAMAVLVRPTNALAVLPVAVCLGASPRRWAWLIAGGAPGAALLLLYNLSAYGHALESGYGNIRSAFSTANVGPSLRNYVDWLPVSLTPIVWLALGVPLLWRRAPRIVTMLVVWIASVCVVYAFYFHTHETWWYLRFLMPAFPPLIVGALLVVQHLFGLWQRRASATSARRRAAVAWVVLGASILVHNLIWERHLGASGIGEAERVYAELSRWVGTHLPPGSAVAAMQFSGALFFYTDFPVLRWEEMNRERFLPIVAALEARGQPLHAVLFPWEIDEHGVLTKLLPGNWTLVAKVGNATVWRFDGPSGDPMP